MTLEQAIAKIEEEIKNTIDGIRPESNDPGLITKWGYMEGLIHGLEFALKLVKSCNILDA